ncbi:hypothetical protein CFC21_043994 [Triticum aestivum]|uniref:KIB1-4 beta-propeller domain-containing protein n=2 Tax=Triticum aestivum TaxID=4565 RepID=A0A3B6FWK6_WHEAT|nr:uncharacterized protein LOC123066442 [Triticum aestivum]KAF7032861.1 hypothetical protein CFC21_043994 [Triticum aestivum]
MAAAPGYEVPTPLAAPVLPSMAAAGWSSLPSDLVLCIADCLLDTNDVDCYVDLRAVCHNWRSATEDPRSDASDPRFHPRFWIVLDDDGAFQSDGCRVLVNTATSRFLRKQLPLPRHYYVVTTTVNGFLVLDDRSPPHAARLLNPLTGAVVIFNAPVPRDASVAVFFSSGGTPHNLIVLCDSTRKYYRAVPDSECFIAGDINHVFYNYMRKVVVGSVYSNGAGCVSVAQSNVIMEYLLDLSEKLQTDFVKFFSVDPLGHHNDVRCFLLHFGGEVFFITMALERVVAVLIVDPTEKQALTPVKTVGRYAIFISHQRCLVVDAAKFPSVEADCVYYTQDVGKFAFIWKHNIRDGKDERVYDDINFVKEDKHFVSSGPLPFTIIQLLSSYTINLSDS